MAKRVIYTDVDGTLTTRPWPVYFFLIIWHRQSSKLVRLWRMMRAVCLGGLYVVLHLVRVIDFEALLRLTYRETFAGMAVAECCSIMRKHFSPTWRLEVLADMNTVRTEEKVALTASVEDLYSPPLRSLGFDRVVGTTLEVVDGHYTGEIQRLMNGRSKAEWMRREDEATTSSSPPAHSSPRDRSETEASSSSSSSKRFVVAYGDSKHDIDMLEAADEAVAVHPDRTLRAHAMRRGWRILSRI